MVQFLVVSESKLNPTVTLKDFGLDSLVAIELRIWWRQNLISTASVLELLNGSANDLGAVAAERLQAKLEGERYGVRKRDGMKEAR